MGADVDVLARGLAPAIETVPPASRANVSVNGSRRARSSEWPSTRNDGLTLATAAVEKAITAEHPKLRVRVTPSAHLLTAQRRITPNAIWDRILRTQFPQPGGRG